MATWKTLTRVNDEPIHVNLDAVLHFQERRGYTTLYFAAPGKEGLHTVRVKEKAHEVRA